MTQNTLQKISNLLQSSKNIFLQPKKQSNIIQNNHPQQLKSQQVKAKLQTCMFSLRQLNQKIKKGQLVNKNIINKSFTQKSKDGLLKSQLPKIANTSFNGQNNQKIKNKFSYKQNSSHHNNSIQKNNISHKNQNDFSILSKQKQISLLANEKSNSSLLSSMRVFNEIKMNQTLLLAQQEKSIDFSSGLVDPLMRTSPLPMYKYVEAKSDQIELQNQARDKSSANKNFNVKKIKTKYNNESQTKRQSSANRQPLFPPRIKKHLYQNASGKALPKQNRYFSDKPITVDQEQINKLGLYESINRYKKQHLVQQMHNLSPKIQKKELEFVKVCKQNELFLTRPKQLGASQLDDFLKEQFVIKQSKPKRYFQTIKTQEIEKRQNKKSNNEQPQNNNNQGTNQNGQNQLINSSADKILQNHNQQSILAQQSNQQYHQQDLIYFSIKNYQLQKTQSYIKFKIQHIQLWSQIESLLNQIIKFLKNIKITSCIFKANNLLEYWSGKKLSNKDIEKILKINIKEITNQYDQAVKSVFNMCFAKKRIKDIIKAKQKRVGYMKWVCDRMVGIRSIKREKEYKIKKAYQIHQKILQGNYNWDVEIYISSFSQNQFVRNSTQYMESFQNMFTHIWKESSKHMILVIPTINSEILQLYQEKLKIKRSITLICPQVHDLFPVNISLAGCLLFSYQALNKIKKLIQGKNAVIIPGKFSQPKYQLLISQFLRAPLMTSLKPRKDFQFQKSLFSSASLSVLPFISIQKNTTIDQIIQRFAKLVICYKQINKWVFKIDGQFGGRGLATFCINSSKNMKSILASCKDTTKPLEIYLRRNLKLKLKINFQNSLFMLGDYLQRLSQKGGIIQQRKQNVDSYQISYFIQNKNCSTLTSCFKSYSVNHSNKAYIYEQVPNMKITSIVSKLRNVLQLNDFLGYVSVNLVLSGDKIYGIQIKPYMTHLSSVEPFIKCLQGKRQLKLNLSSGHNKMENQLISSTLRNDFLSKRRTQPFNNQDSLLQQNNIPNKNSPQKSQVSNNNSHSYGNHARIPSQQSNFLSNLNLTELQTIRQQNLPPEYTYLFIPNIILTDVPIPKKAQFLQLLVRQTLLKHKFDILDNNLTLYMSNGLGLNLLIIGKQIKKMKKIAIQVIRSLSQRSGQLKIYCGKNQARDVFQFGDIIKAITQIKG